MSLFVWIKTIKNSLVIDSNKKTVDLGTSNDIHFRRAKISKCFYKNPLSTTSTLLIVVDKSAMNQTYDPENKIMHFASFPLHSDVALSYSNFDPVFWDFHTTSNEIFMDKISFYIYQGDSLVSDASLATTPVIFELCLF